MEKSEWTKVLPEAETTSAREDARDQLRALEQDIRNLMRGSAEARLSLAEIERQHADSTRRFLLGIAEVPDAFQRVFRAIHAKEDQVTPQVKIWIGNFRTVLHLLERVLADQGLAKIEILDQGFDPQWHKAAEVIADPSKADGTILQQVKPGYMWRGQVIRKAEVAVVRNSNDE